MGMGCLGSAHYSPNQQPSTWIQWTEIAGIYLNAKWSCSSVENMAIPVLYERFCWGHSPLEIVPHPNTCMPVLSSTNWLLLVVSQVLCHLLIKLIPNWVVLFSLFLNCILHMYIVCHDPQSKSCSIKSLSDVSSEGVLFSPLCEQLLLHICGWFGRKDILPQIESI